ncbi:hypothetical protein RHGRI_033787 [Rhododendron griersonianum]|uniref:Uncharacterized protein n=1 Tax=Rhododendron griersonianum TaxID=479676 RepID=A0AAV6I3N6_9ERIC|nr:hypothetical protein RHGRI_033787 [Rhododendron griersonianum]
MGFFEGGERWVGAEWIELDWLKEKGYYGIEEFVANRLEVASRLSWLNCCSNGKKKGVRLKDKASAVGVAANAYWRKKGCVDWWEKLDASTRKNVFRVILGKSAKSLSVPVQAWQTPPLLQYFGALWTKGKLNAFESLELSQLVLEDLEDWAIGTDFRSRLPRNTLSSWELMHASNSLSSSKSYDGLYLLHGNPGNAPFVVGQLLDDEGVEDFIKGLILSIRSLLLVEPPECKILPCSIAGSHIHIFLCPSTRVWVFVVKDGSCHAVNSIQQMSNSLFPCELHEIVRAKAEVIEESAKIDMLLKAKRVDKEEKRKSLGTQEQ